MQNARRVAMVLAALVLAGCTPLIVGGAVVLADEAVEQKKGGDGLF
ncbi:hypothetical protein [Tabrizicola sp.]|nr:hypothetical protein [Tabrizicola sp.]MDM7931398.1 hypothetical protein [Tabrizicola sp.]